MAKNLTETSTFTANVSVPEGGNARTAASIETAFQALTNRTRKLNDRLDLLTAPVSRYLAAISNPDWYAGYVSPPQLDWSCDIASSKLWFPIELRDGDILTSVSALVFQGNAGSGGRMNMEVWRQTQGASGAPTLLQLGSTTTFAAGAGYQTGSVAVASNGTIARSTSVHFVVLQSSSLAATITDQVHWVKAAYTPVGAP